MRSNAASRNACGSPTTPNISCCKPHPVAIQELGLKRSLARREFALGVEGLEGFVHKELSRRSHECVFEVLAPESEPVGPRLRFKQTR